MSLQAIIEAAFERRAEITPKTVDAETKSAVEQVIAGLDNGSLRVAEKKDGEWVVNQWVKKAVLLSFRIADNEIIDGAETKFYDKVPTLSLIHISEPTRPVGISRMPSSA